MHGHIIPPELPPAALPWGTLVKTAVWNCFNNPDLLYSGRILAGQYDVKTVVLKKTVEEDAAREMIDSKKAGVFKSLFKRTKRDEVHVHSLNLYYECILTVSGKYVADYYRKATHTISVDYNVREAVFGDGVFPARTRSGIGKAIARKHGKNKIDLPLEEHVFVTEEDEMAFDHHGQEVSLPFKVNFKTVENYPRRLLSKSTSNVKKPEITYDAALSKLQELLKKPMGPDVRNLNEEFVLREITELYVPVFEARLIGPKKKVGILRLDAVRKKFL